MKELWTRPRRIITQVLRLPAGAVAYPKPAQKPHPPVILGGHARTVLERIVEWGDGWLPNRATPAEIEAGRKKLDDLARKAGRNPSAITISVFGQPADRDLIRQFHDAGAARVIVRPELTSSESQMQAELTRIADAVLR
jgi:alkanesulfonate monooxygenase SsuD/methylene tetrahydromethanopterin reductase-like flavin-dependent oxidoreductase (luciferase family)